MGCSTGRKGIKKKVTCRFLVSLYTMKVLEIVSMTQKPKQARAVRTRQKLLDAAAETLCELGYATTTTPLRDGLECLRGAIQAVW